MSQMSPPPPPDVYSEFSHRHGNNQRNNQSNQNSRNDNTSSPYRNQQSGNHPYGPSIQNFQLWKCFECIFVFFVNICKYGTFVSTMCQDSASCLLLYAALSLNYNYVCITSLINVLSTMLNKERKNRRYWVHLIYN